MASMRSFRCDYFCLIVDIAVVRHVRVLEEMRNVDLTIARGEVIVVWKLFVVAMVCTDSSSQVCLK